MKPNKFRRTAIAIVIAFSLVTAFFISVYILPILHSSTLFYSTGREAVREFYQEEDNTLDYRIKGCYPYFGNNPIVPSDEYNETEELEPANSNMLNDLLEF